VNKEKMFPGGASPKQMAKMMKRMGVKMEELDVEEVIIRCVDKEIRITEPQVIKTVVQGQEMFQVSGNVVSSEVEAAASINDDDIEMVAEQAGVSKDAAAAALEESGGDIAEAIISLKT